MQRTLLNAIAFMAIAASSLAQTVYWSGPTSVSSGASYTEQASQSGPYPAMTLWKNNTAVTSGSGTVSWTTTDTGNTSVSWKATGSFPTSYRTVTVSLISMTPPTSSNASVTYGTSWFPTINLPPANGGGQGIWCVVGQTNWNKSSWTAPGVGTYSFNVGQQADTNHQGNATDATYGSIEVNGSSYTLTITKAPMTPPTPSSTSYTIKVGQAWGGPGINLPSGNGSGSGLWDVAGQTNWGTGSWTPGSAGSYSFYVAQKADANHTGNNTDPNQGDIEVNGSGYSLTVTSHLTVVNGSGSGDYAVGSQVTITSNTPGTGQQFSGWSLSGPGSISNPGSSSTTFTVGSNNATVTAGYSTSYYQLTVSGGSGGGSYAYNTSVPVSANAPATGWHFSNWSASPAVGSFGNASSSSTTYTMAASSVTVTANFGINQYSVSVVSGAGSGTYNYNSTFNISASAAPAGKHFAGWTQSGPGSLGSSGSSSTTFTVGLGNATLTATYADNTSAPVITQQPASLTVNQNQPATFTVVASGSPAPTYQWYKNGTAIPGATSATFSIASAQPADAASYTVVVTNSQGSITSSAATLTVVAVPVITSGTTASGALQSPFSYTITATGSPTSFGATGLPTGLSINTTTGAISGTPTQTGTFNVSLTATNASGPGTGTLTLTVYTASSIDLNVHLPLAQ